MSESVDKRFVLITDNGDKLYPYKKYQKKTDRYGFALTKPGEQDRNGQATYTDSIEEVIRRLLFDDWSVRAKTKDKVGQNELKGTYGINKKTVHAYEIYEEFIYLTKSANLKPRNVFSNNTEQFQITSEKENPIDEITFAAIKSRRGQPEFRKELLTVYSGCCCITGCNLEAVLEAAHIVPHTEETNYSQSNGLLLRADIHTLFDLNLIGVDSKGIIFVSHQLKDSEYWQFNGKVIAENISETMSLNLMRRFKQFSISK